MKIFIKYCPTSSGYKEKAQSVQSELTTNFENMNVELIEGGEGEFSVIYQEDPPGLIFSSEEYDVFPGQGEITSRLVKQYGCENRRTKYRGL